MDDEFAFGIIVAVILFWAAALAVWAYFFVEPVPPRSHLFWCWNQKIEVAFPCKYRRNDPVDVTNGVTLNPGALIERSNTY